MQRPSNPFCYFLPSFVRLDDLLTDIPSSSVTLSLSLALVLLLCYSIPYAAVDILDERGWSVGRSVGRSVTWLAQYSQLQGVHLD